MPSRARNTKNSVDPIPGRSPEYCAILPFSRHGVMRAKSVSPGANFDPEPVAGRSWAGYTRRLPGVTTSMLTNGTCLSRGRETRGFSSIKSLRIMSRPQNPHHIHPNSQRINQAGVQATDNSDRGAPAIDDHWSARWPHAPVRWRRRWRRANAIDAHAAIARRVA